LRPRFGKHRRSWEQTLLCTYLSAVLLIGLLLNSLFGWSWADPIAALVIAVIAAIAVEEGYQRLAGRHLLPSTGRARHCRQQAAGHNRDCCKD
jgi:CHASE2 domain-containing sensor protein